MTYLGRPECRRHIWRIGRDPLGTPIRVCKRCRARELLWRPDLDRPTTTDTEDIPC